jgi:eukaryotic-like serine/threonine-protein kinase
MDPASDDPATLGRYRVQSRLGAGGMGRVLLGIDESGRRAALKIVHAELAADPGFRERFRREVQMAAAAPPWFTAPVLDADPDAAQPWLATQFVVGPSLRSYVTDQGQLTEQGVTALAVRMAEGLVALHAAGLVHRDLKPSNVLLADDGPRLIDFGISRAADTTALTQTGHVMGTPEYMSPEQAGGARDIGPASDMFTFGSLLVFAATGRSPFAADSAAGSLYRIVYSEPDLGPLSGRVREAVQACLTKDPAGRPTAAQVRGLLRAADAENQVAPEPTEVLSTGPLVPATPPTLVGLTPDSTLPGGVPVAARPPPARMPTFPPPPPPPPARATRPPWLIPVAAIVAVVFVASVALGVALIPRNVGAPAAVGPTPDPAAATSAAGPSTDPAAGATVIDAETDGRYGTGGARFASPSRNIACVMTADQVRCDVASTTWQLPPKPADCTGAFGTGAAVSGTGSGQLTCAGDTVADPALTALPYGQGVRFAGVVCVSSETGMRCTNAATGHGFRVARASYDLF